MSKTTEPFWKCWSEVMNAEASCPRILCWVTFFHYLSLASLNGLVLYIWPLNVEPTYNVKATFSTKESMLRWLYFRESVSKVDKKLIINQWPLLVDLGYQVCHSKFTIISHTLIIDREAREIMHLVASVRLSVSVRSHGWTVWPTTFIFCMGVDRDLG